MDLAPHWRGHLLLFDAKPPRISTPAVQSIGQVPAVSQYDWLGRRFFVAVKTKL